MAYRPQVTFDRSRPRLRGGARRDQDGNLGPGATPSPADARGHDWSAFDDTFRKRTPRTDEQTAADMKEVVAASLVHGSAGASAKMAEQALRPGATTTLPTPSRGVAVPPPRTDVDNGVPRGTRSAMAMGASADPFMPDPNRQLHLPQRPNLEGYTRPAIRHSTAVEDAPAGSQGFLTAAPKPGQRTVDVGLPEVVTSNADAFAIHKKYGAGAPAGRIVYRPGDTRPGYTGDGSDRPQLHAVNGVSPAGARNDFNGPAPVVTAQQKAAADANIAARTPPAPPTVVTNGNPAPMPPAVQTPPAAPVAKRPVAPIAGPGGVPPAPSAPLAQRPLVESPQAAGYDPFHPAPFITDQVKGAGRAIVDTIAATAAQAMYGSPKSSAPAPAAPSTVAAPVAPLPPPSPGPAGMRQRSAQVAAQPTVPGITPIPGVTPMPPLPASNVPQPGFDGDGNMIRKPVFGGVQEDAFSTGSPPKRVAPLPQSVAQVMRPYDPTAKPGDEASAIAVRNPAMDAESVNQLKGSYADDQAKNPFAVDLGNRQMNDFGARNNIPGVNANTVDEEAKRRAAMAANVP